PAAVALGMQELRACRPRTLAADVAIAREMDLTATAADVRVPTLLLCGSRDRVTPPALSRDLHAMIAGARPEIVDGAGHMRLNTRHWRLASSLRSPRRCGGQHDDGGERVVERARRSGPDVLA